MPSPPADDPASPPARDPRALVQRVQAQLHERGERMTAQRAAVLTALARTEGHLSAEEVHAAVAAGDARVHPASIYRTLEALSHLDVVQHIHLGHGATAYHLIDETQAHPHAQCSVCGTVVDLPVGLLDAVAERVAAEHGFVVDAAHAALSGTCRACSQRPQEPA